jgi:hypothetical protein
MSNYPDSVDSFTPLTGTDSMSEHAERHTAEESAIVATQQELDATKALLADMNTSTLSLSEAVDVRAATLTTQKDANEYFAAEFENKLDKTPTWGELAGRP